MPRRPIDRDEEIQEYRRLSLCTVNELKWEIGARCLDIKVANLKKHNLIDLIIEDNRNRPKTSLKRSLDYIIERITIGYEERGYVQWWNVLANNQVVTYNGQSYLDKIVRISETCYYYFSDWDEEWNYEEKNLAHRFGTIIATYLTERMDSYCNQLEEQRRDICYIGFLMKTQRNLLTEEHLKKLGNKVLKHSKHVPALQPDFRPRIELVLSDDETEEPPGPTIPPLNTFPLLDLPPEMIDEVFSHLSLATLLILARTSQELFVHVKAHKGKLVSRVAVPSSRAPQLDVPYALFSTSDLSEIRWEHMTVIVGVNIDVREVKRAFIRAQEPTAFKRSDEYVNKLLTEIDDVRMLRWLRKEFKWTEPGIRIFFQKTFYDRPINLGTIHRRNSRTTFVSSFGTSSIRVSCCVEVIYPKGKQEAVTSLAHGAPYPNITNLFARYQGGVPGTPFQPCSSPLIRFDQINSIQWVPCPRGAIFVEIQGMMAVRPAY